MSTNIITIKKYRISMIFLSIFIFIIARFLLPSTDEADYHDRINTILNIEAPFFSYYKYFKPLFININPSQDFLEFDYYIIRLLFSFLIVFPIYIFILIINSSQIDSHSLWVDKKYVAILTLLFPGIWFHLGLFSVESFTLMLFLFIIFINNIALKILLLIAASMIDIGNTAIFLLFIIYYLFINSILNKFGKKYMVIFIIILLIICNVFSMSLLQLIEWLPLIGDKAIFIIDQYNNVYQINDKYPLVLRPFIALMSMIFMLPVSHLMAWPIYPACFYFLVKIGWKAILDENINLNMTASFFAAITLFLTVPMILPGFSNGKYYVFIIPFILNIGLYYYKKSKVFNFIILSNFIVFLCLIFNLIID